MKLITLLCFALATVIRLGNAGCPYASMMHSYKFNGAWWIEDLGLSLHVCQVGKSVYFGVTQNATQNLLIGVGSGNWSQYTMNIRGYRYFLNNSIDMSPFIIG